VHREGCWGYNRVRDATSSTRFDGSKRRAAKIGIDRCTEGSDCIERARESPVDVNQAVHGDRVVIA